MKYETEEEIAAVVKAFEKATITRGEWRHAEHLVVANHYLAENDFDAAHEKMRAGIFNLLRAFAIDLTVEMPYHETLTVFWLKTIYNYRKSKLKCSNLEICNEIVARFDKDYPLKFYSREFLFSAKAREKFVEGDI